MSTDPAVVADIGGTHARFALCSGGYELDRVRVLRCEDYPDIRSAIDAYLELESVAGVSRFCLAVASPVDQDSVNLPNNPWAFSRSALAKGLGAPVTLMNDFTAQAMSLDALGRNELQWLDAPRPTPGGIRVVLGPGTGLGIAVRVTDTVVVPSEGGHIGFSPVNEHEVELLKRLLTRFRRVSVERLLSGPGLENIYFANHDILGVQPDPRHKDFSAASVSALAASGDAIALRSVEDFLDILATYAGDAALFSWATGGVYLTGGVLRKLDHFLDVDRFRARFSDKGRFTQFCESTPVAVIKHEAPGLLGCTAYLARMADGEPTSG